MRPLPILILLFFLSLGGESAWASEGEGLAEKNSLWRSEVQLARTSQIYLIFDLSEKRISIKIRGAVLKEMPIASVSQWGTQFQPKGRPLMSKSADRKPERQEVKPPQKDQENPPEVPALQVDHMPWSYRLYFDEGIRVEVRPQSDGILPALTNFFFSLKTSLFTRPLKALWKGLHGESFTEIVIYLQEKDAKALYWAFQEGFPCIIRGPSP
jgi:hypothetical protein